MVLSAESDGNESRKNLNVDNGEHAVMLSVADSEASRDNSRGYLERIVGDQSDHMK
jgi:hypothetical protein